MAETVEQPVAPKAAERLLVREVPVFHVSSSVGEIEHELLGRAEEFSAINYIYIVDKQNILVGILSIKELFRRAKEASIEEVMTDEVISIRPHTSEDRLASLAIRHNLKEIPVVDSDKRFLGAVPYDTIVNILRRKNIDEVLKSAGIHKFQSPAKTLANASVGTLIRKRLPWLLIGLGGSIAAATVISQFQATLASQLLLAAFIPAVTYISGAVGVQSETMLIRTSVLDKNFIFSKYLLREAKVGVGLAAALSLSMFFISYIIWSSQVLSIVLGLSIFIAILISMHVAIFLPWLLAKMKFDPAITGGPLDTILSDIVSISLYLTFANLILGMLG